MAKPDVYLEGSVVMLALPFGDQYGRTYMDAGEARALAKELQDAADEMDPPRIPLDPTEAEIVT